MVPRKLVVLSDLHIGVDAPTNWYQSALHEPFLRAALEHVQSQAAAVEELVFLGDLVDQWTYLPSTQPPRLADIVAKNPGIFGAGGALPATLDALEGRITYMHGNHDMALTAEELATVRSPRGHTMRMAPSMFYEPPLGNGQIVCTHGHTYSIFNAVEPARSARLGLPIGHLITRLSSLWASQRLTPGQTVADRPDSGDPSGWSMDKAALTTLASSILERRDALADLLVDALLEATGQSRALPVQLLDGSWTTAGDACAQFASLWSSWSTGAAADAARYGSEPALFALLDTDVRNSLHHFATVLANRYRVVLMGHTHVSEDEWARPHLIGRGSAYANSGFQCPARPDMERPNGPSKPVFLEIEAADEAGGRRYTIAVRSVSMQQGRAQVDAEPLATETIAG